MTLKSEKNIENTSAYKKSVFASPLTSYYERTCGGFLDAISFLCRMCCCNVVVVVVVVVHSLTLHIYIGSLFRYTLAHSSDTHWLTLYIYIGSHTTNTCIFELKTRVVTVRFGEVARHTAYSLNCRISTNTCLFELGTRVMTIQYIMVTKHQ